MNNINNVIKTHYSTGKILTHDMEKYTERKTKYVQPKLRLRFKVTSCYNVYTNNIHQRGVINNSPHLALHQLLAKAIPCDLLLYNNIWLIVAATRSPTCICNSKCIYFVIHDFIVIF